MRWPCQEFYALVYRNDEVQQVNQRERAFPEPSTLHASLLDIQRTTFSNVSFGWDQVTSGLIVETQRFPEGRALWRSESFIPLHSRFKRQGVDKIISSRL